MGVCGYGLIFFELFGLGHLLRLFLPPTISIDLLWYGLYFGILGRDCAEVASDWMVRFVNIQHISNQVHADTEICRNEHPG